MDKKLRQVTDNIHGTIFLSSLESELISTPYFYRLHDIYQSSTVYMTYPSNRTKRYEHSLGTMELASTMLYTSVLNADTKTKTELFKNLEKYFHKIYDLIINDFEAQVAPYFRSNKDLLEEIFNDDEISEEKIDEYINTAISEGYLADSALDYFQYYPTQSDKTLVYDDSKKFFLYRCLLQAVRIVALFHDVGHPPYSHIIEEVLEELRQECSEKNDKNTDNGKVENFNTCLDKYYDKLKIQTLFSDSTLPLETNSALHERIGISFLQSAIDDIIPTVIKKVLESDIEYEATPSDKRVKNNNYKVVMSLYYFVVVEFAISMLIERDIFFKSFHKIVDGVLDADRLDYITRDSLNSGIDWGTIPYKRLLNSAKLVYIDSKENGESINVKDRPFVIAYPQKVSDDIEDLLLTRYKIFARINFHHRCMKTATALKSSVKILAEDYLYENSDYFNSDINMLWNSLNLKAGSI